MRRSTAVRHLVEIGTAASDHLSLRETEIGWPLEEVWVSGDLLGAGETIEHSAVIMRLDMPADELPWLSMNGVAEWVGERLRLRKRPLDWFYRPLAWPAWSVEHRQVLRFWSAEDGLDERVVDGLRATRRIGLPVVEPSPAELVSQLDRELLVARAHLRDTLDRYWDRGWRREHSDRNEGVAPEDHLWRAAHAVTELQDALDSLRVPGSAEFLPPDD